MKILGMQKLTLLDYPGHVGAVLFLDGCNFRCPFCQNGSLVLAPEALPQISREELFRFLEKRRGILEGICVTGGEPTIHRELPELIRAIRDFGYLVKLDTNGTNPSMLARLLEEGLLDYAAMDIKAGHLHYGAASGITWDFGGISGGSPDFGGTGGITPGLGGISGGSPDLGAAARQRSMDRLLEKIERSVRLLQDSAIDYEFRTTAVRGIHTEEDFLDISQWLEGCPHYYLQSFRDNPEVLLKNHPFSAFRQEELERFLSLVQKKIPQARLRGV